MASIPHQALYQNQLQFNLAVPLSTRNLAAQFQHPAPILVERIGGHNGIPGKPSQEKMNQQRERANNSANYSVLSEDKMEMMSQLARRDLQNQQRKAQMASQSPHRPSAPSSPARNQKAICSRHTRNPNIPSRQKHQPLRARQAEKNRRLGAVQTPPANRKDPGHSRLGEDSFFSTKNASVNVTTEPDIQFPIKPTPVMGREAPTDEMSKLQQEMEDYLSILENIALRAVAEGHTRFLRASEKAKGKDGFLDHEEDAGRTKVRAEEQNTRSARNVYNLRQKVKQLQRDVAHADLNKPAKKLQLVNQLTSVQRGATKSLQAYLQNLAHQDLARGLAQPYSEMSLLLRQLTALSVLTQADRKERSSRLLELLDSIDSLNNKWAAAATSATTQKPDHELGKEVKDSNKQTATKVTKEWVSDTKVQGHFGPVKFRSGAVPPGKRPVGFVSRREAAMASRGRKGRPASGKENKGKIVAQNERKAALRSGISALMAQRGQQQQDGQQQQQQQQQHQPQRPGVAWEVDIGGPTTTAPPSFVPEHAKGYMLPSDLVAKRERAQRAVELSNRAHNYYHQQGERSHHFAEPTIAASLKSVASPARRASSAPASPKQKKEVNFVLDSKNLVPWKPAGSGSKSPRSRSLSGGRERRSPFYVRDLDKQDIRGVYAEMFSQSERDSSRKDKGFESYGFRSLPTQDKLRSHPVSDSLLDDLEDRLYDRLMMRRVTEYRTSPHSPMMKSHSQSDLELTATSAASHTDQEDNDHDHDYDSALDITDLDTGHSAVSRKAASIMDAPTLENIKLRLAEMQREQMEIRQRWSSFKFVDTQRRTRNFAASEMPSQCPPAIKVNHMSRSEGLRSSHMPVNKDWTEEPLLFTKSASKPAPPHVQFQHSFPRQSVATTGHLPGPLTAGGLVKPRKMLTMKQTAVERIAAERDRYESYLRKRSHHPTGKFDPWKLIEEISDEILSDCLQEVAGEVEQVNEEIANHMYTSEFMVDTARPSDPSEHPPNYLPVQAAGEVVTFGGKLEGKVLEAPEKKDFSESDLAGLGVGDFGGGGEARFNVSANQLVAEEVVPDSVRSVPLSAGGSLRSQGSKPSSQQQSPHGAVSATEPDLDDVSHFMTRVEETSGSAGDKRGGEEVESPGREDEYEDDEKDSFEDDEESYSEEDFEDVSDVEL